MNPIRLLAMTNPMVRRDKKDIACDSFRDWASWYEKRVLSGFPSSSPETRAGEGSAATDDKVVLPEIMMSSDISKTDAAYRGMERRLKKVVEIEYLFHGSCVEKLLCFERILKVKKTLYSKFLDECLSIRSSM